MEYKGEGVRGENERRIDLISLMLLMSDKKRYVICKQWKNMKNPKEIFIGKRFLFLFFIAVIFFLPLVDANSQLQYKKFTTPTFIFNDEPLFYSLNATYTIDNHSYETYLSDFPDSNLFLAPTIVGKKFYYDTKRSSKLSCDNIIFIETNFGSPYSICVEPSANYGGVDIPLEIINYYPTAVEGADQYFNNASIEGNVLIHYQILNSNITKFSPIVLNLGKWPVKVDNKKIDDVLNEPIYNQTLIFYGKNKALIVNTRNNTGEGVVVIPPGVSKQIDYGFFKNLSNTLDFYYIIYERQGNYFLKTENITPNLNSSYGFYFRPITINYAMKIEEPIIDATYDPKDDNQKFIKFKPNLNIEITNNEIPQLKFCYVERDLPKEKEIPLNTDGKYLFNDYVYAQGDPFKYPLDNYRINFSVYPPLLIQNEKEIEMPSNSPYEGTISIDSDTISIDLNRSKQTLYIIIISLILAILSLFLSIYPLISKKEIPDTAEVILIFIIFSVSILSILLSNLFGHIWSMGGLAVILSEFVIISVFLLVVYKRRITLAEKIRGLLKNKPKKSSKNKGKRFRRNSNR